MIAKSLGIVSVGASIAVLLAINACSPATEEVVGPAPPGETEFSEAAAIDAVVETAMAEHRIPGVAVAVVRQGEVLLSKGYGLADLEHQVRVTPETMFQSGSVGKMFTAAAAMVMVEEGRLDLDVPIKTYIPEAPAMWDAITLRHLLSHTSGIPDYTTDEMDYTRDYPEDDLVRTAIELELEFPAGEQWNYSNTGYVMLGIIIGRVAEQPYWELLRERVWDPGSVPTIRVNFATDIVPHRSSGYHLEDGELTNQGWVAPSLNSTADGSLLLSLQDMIAWNEVVRNRAVLSPQSWDAMLTPILLNSGEPYPYGFGWGVTELGGHPVHEHGGGWQGFRTQYTRIVDDDIAIVVLTNASHAEPGEIAEAIAGVLDPTYANDAG